MSKEDPKTPPKTQNWLIFLMVAIGIFMATLDGSIVNIASISGKLGSPVVPYGASKAAVIGQSSLPRSRIIRQ